MDPSRRPPPKKAMLSACVLSREWRFLKAPSRKYSCQKKAVRYAASQPQGHGSLIFSRKRHVGDGEALLFENDSAIARL